MERDITATEAVRDFSEMLNQIVYRGDAFVIHRNGKPAARLLPCERSHPARRLGELERLFAALPRLGSEAEAFRRDLENALADQLAAPQESAWE